PGLRGPGPCGPGLCGCCRRGRLAGPAGTGVTGVVVAGLRTSDRGGGLCQPHPSGDQTGIADDPPCRCRHDDHSPLSRFSPRICSGIVSPLAIPHPSFREDNTVTVRDHGDPGDAPTIPPPLQPPRNPARPSAAEEARTILASTNTATLATLTADGDPWASFVT